MGNSRVVGWAFVTNWQGLYSSSQCSIRLKYLTGNVDIFSTSLEGLWDTFAHYLVKYLRSVMHIVAVEDKNFFLFPHIATRYMFTDDMYLPCTPSMGLDHDKRLRTQ